MTARDAAILSMWGWVRDQPGVDREMAEACLLAILCDDPRQEVGDARRRILDEWLRLDS